MTGARQKDVYVIASPLNTVPLALEPLAAEDRFAHDVVDDRPELLVDVLRRTAGEFRHKPAQLSMLFDISRIRKHRKARRGL